MKQTDFENFLNNNIVLKIGQAGFDRCRFFSFCFSVQTIALYVSNSVYEYIFTLKHNNSYCRSMFETDVFFAKE